MLYVLREKESLWREPYLIESINLNIPHSGQIGLGVKKNSRLCKLSLSVVFNNTEEIGFNEV